MAEAFDAGEISWTKAREVARVATRETEREWLARAKRLSNRALDRLVRQELPEEDIEHLHLDMPADVKKVWRVCEELAERLSGSELAGYQVLEAIMAEFLATCGPDFRTARARSLSLIEDDIPPEVRELVYQRDQWRCRFTDCTMRAELDIHHLNVRSRGGDHSPENLIVVCRAHHALVHQGICRVRGKAPDQLVCEKPFVDKPAGACDELLPGASEEDVLLGAAEEATGEGGQDVAALGELGLDAGDEAVVAPGELSLDAAEDETADPELPRTRVRPPAEPDGGPPTRQPGRSRSPYPRSMTPGWLVREGETYSRESKRGDCRDSGLPATRHTGVFEIRCRAGPG